MTSQAPKAVSVSIPGKILLAGEYSILRGGRTLSGAVDARLTLDISASDSFRIRSDLWPETRSLPSLPSEEPLLDSLQFAAQKFGISGAQIDVQSDLDISFGLGSSSAVRLAAHLASAAFALQRIALTRDEMWDAARDAWRLQQLQQGFASGYDLVTQIEGGFVEWTADYERWPGPNRNLTLDWLQKYVHPYTGGIGAPTKKVGGSVRKWLDSEQLWAELEGKTSDLIDALLSQNQSAIVTANAHHRNLFANAPFYPQELDKKLAPLRGFDRSWTFKTTGAGGEDAILLIGHQSDLTDADRELRKMGWSPLPNSWTECGSHVTWKDLGP